MVQVASRRRFDDEYDEDGNGPFDKRYPGMRVIADKGRVTVPLRLTDSWLPSSPRRFTVVDARVREH
jgi:hypothetical protein